jgi:hypothetical protein
MPAASGLVTEEGGGCCGWGREVGLRGVVGRRCACMRGVVGGREGMAGGPRCGIVDTSPACVTRLGSERRRVREAGGLPTRAVCHTVGGIRDGAG